MLKHALFLAVLGRVVSVSAGDGPIGQIWAHADPSDARYLMVCGNQNDPSVSYLWSGYVYLSADGGRTWSRTLRDNSGHWVSEESCTYGSSGHAYYAAGVSNLTHVVNDFDFGHLHVYASDDHGLTWKTPWVRSKGWVDWTYLQTIPAANGPEKIVIFANSANNGPGHHWVQAKPVALESTDGARSFSDVMTSSQLPGHRLAGIFAGGSTVLPDGTALFSASAGLVKLRSSALDSEQAMVFAFSPSTRALSPRSSVRTSPLSAGFAIPLTQDASDGAFHGRLYSVGIENGRLNTPGSIWLGTSNDRGYHWSSRTILRGSTSASPISVHIAVNNAGILGILWADTNADLFFASSADGGKTFGITSTVATFPVTNDLLSSSTEAVAWDEDWLSETLNVHVYGRQVAAAADADFSHLGLSVRMNTGQWIGDVQIVADARDIFHVFWAQPNAQNDHRLLTRSIEVSAPPIATTTTSSLQLPRTLHVLPVNLSAALKLPTPAVTHWSTQRLAIPGWHDISSSISLDLKKPQYDASSHMIEVNVTLINTSRHVIRGQLAFIGFDMHSDFGVSHAVNAHSWVKGWPSWDLTDLLPAHGLQPGGQSKPLHLEFQISNFRSLPAMPLLHLAGNIVAMHVGVYHR